MKTYTLGIDIGTGSTKGIAINESGKILHSFSVSYSTEINKNHHEQNPQQLLDAFFECVAGITKALGAPDAIGISSAMHSMMLLNAVGNPTTELITWADGRAYAHAKHLHESELGKKIYEESGTPIHPMSPLCKLAWFNEHAPEKLKNAHKIIGIKEFIWSKLFGVYEIDFSIASATGLFNINHREWSTHALQFAGISSEQLSNPVPTSFNRQLIDPEKLKILGVGVDTKFIIGASDGCLANLGSNAITPGTAALTIGTSGAIRVAHSEPLFDYESMPFNYILDNETLIIGGPINNGGSVLKWFIEEILKEDESVFEDLLEKTTTVNAGSDGLLILPYLMGERAPIWNAEASGVFLGVRNYHTQLHFVKALMEGICFALYNVGEKLESKIGFDKIHISGGIIRSTEWLQMIANVFNKEVYQFETADASAVGAAYLANPEILRNQKPQRIFYPTSEIQAVYKELYTMFQTLYVKLKPLMSTLTSRVK